jgi:hypothetical protein
MTRKGPDAQVSGRHKNMATHVGEMQRQTGDCPQWESHKPIHGWMRNRPHHYGKCLKTEKRVRQSQFGMRQLTLTDYVDTCLCDTCGAEFTIEWCPL